MRDGVKIGFAVIQSVFYTVAIFNNNLQKSLPRRFRISAGCLPVANQCLAFASFIKCRAKDNPALCEENVVRP